ncbi:MAG: oxygenase MpaB family protein [Bacillota bacterium]
MRYTDEALEGLRAEGDPEPDRILGELIREGQVEEANAILRHLIQNSQPVPEELPDNIEFWLREGGTLPAWVDRSRIDRASALFVEHGVTISLILATASLVECYAAVKGVKVLTFSYRLGQNAYRRVAETAQFVILVMTPGGLYEGGQGIKAIQKVRLMHAAIRNLVAATGRWEQRELGVPICQEDMLGTLMAFSYIVIRDLRKLGVEVGEQEAEDFIYFWRVAGELLGIRPEVIPATMAEVRELTEAIARRHHGPSPEGVQMTRALLEMHADLIPGELFDGIVPALIRELVGDRVADWMEVPESRWEAVLEHKRLIGGWFDAVQRNLQIVRNVVNRLGIALMTRQAIALAGYERAAFQIPTELRQVWGIDGPGTQAAAGEQGGAGA